MPEVFINYRTGDGDETAALVDEHLSNRFGAERIFRAGKSIPPGADYREALVREVRASMVLITIIGPGWCHHPGLADPNDWVRQEILEAYAQGLPVIPVLKGRMTPRLDAAELPAELDRLANSQSIVLDTRDNTAGLARIGDEVADLVPTLQAADRTTQETLEPGATPSTASDIVGAVSQSRDIGGSAVNVSGNHGPIQFHAGHGDINDGSTHITGNNHGQIGHQFGGSRGDEAQR